MLQQLTVGNDDVFQATYQSLSQKLYVTNPYRRPSGGYERTIKSLTADDLMKFAGALMSNELLKAETLAEATRPQFTTGAYGFGFQIGRPDEARTYGHGGAAPGMNGSSIMNRGLNAGLGLIVQGFCALC